MKQTCHHFASMMDTETIVESSSVYNDLLGKAIVYYNKKNKKNNTTGRNVIEKFIVSSKLPNNRVPEKEDCRSVNTIIFSLSSFFILLFSCIGMYMGPLGVMEGCLQCVNRGSSSDYWSSRRFFLR